MASSNNLTSEAVPTMVPPKRKRNTSPASAEKVVFAPLTEKQIAQAYVLNDIVMHELIQDAIQQLEECLNSRKGTSSLSQYDIFSRIVKIVLRSEFADIFDISQSDVILTLKTDYVDEIKNLVMEYQKK